MKISALQALIRGCFARVCSAIGLAFITAWPSLAQDAGALDPGFGSANPPDGAVQVVVGDSAQRLLVGGDFTKLGEKRRPRIARLDANGTVDDSFDPREGFNGSVYAIAIQGDGKILVGGSFSAFDGTIAPFLARLNADGTLDTTFQTGGLNSTVFSIIPLANGDLLVGGGFTAFSLNNITQRQYLVRLHANGTLDATFNALPNSTIYAVAVQPDGQVLIGGDFTTVNGQPRGRVARLNSNGTLDNSFNSGGGADGTVRSITVLGNGEVLVGGVFGTFNGGPFRYLARLSGTGLPNVDFQANPAGPVYAAAVQLDGRIVIAGDLPGRIARRRSNGGDDSTFNVQAGGNSTVAAIWLQANGDIVGAGSLTQWNGNDRRYLVRLAGSKPAAGGQIDFAASAYVVSESQPSVTLEVRRTGNTANAVTVDVATSNETAKGGDYFAKSETLSFGAGETKKSFIVTLRQDTEVEDDETFSVTLSNATGGAEIGVEGSAQIRIISDDNSSVVGSVDTAFGAGNMANVISALSVNSEGKILVAGDFRVIRGQSRFNIARLDDSGGLDSTFISSAWMDAPVFALATQDDGKVLVGGSFQRVNGQNRRFIGRLNRDGTLDNVFNPGTGPNSYIYAFVPLPLGDCFAAGSFTAYDDAPANYLIKLFGDGSSDGTFNPQINGTVYALVLQPDGKLLIGGDFTQVGGLLRNRIARLNPDGSADGSFDPGQGVDGSVRTISIQADGRIVIGGTFGTVNGGSWRYLARLLPSGLPDTTFAPNPIGAVYVTVVQPDGRILAGGDFPGRLARFTANGSADPTLETSASGADGTVFAIATQADGRIVAGGSFKKFDKFVRNGLVRVQGASAGAAGEFEFVNELYSVSEAQPSVALEIRRNGNAAQGASVAFATVAGSANAGDFVAQSSKVNFAPDETKHVVNIVLKPDTDLENSETFFVTLSNPSTGSSLGAVRTAQVTIRNDDLVYGAGAIDAAFEPNPSGASVSTIAAAPDGTIIVGGDFRVMGGKSRVNLTRLFPDGQVDESFYPALWLNAPVLTALVQPDDGKVVAGGQFNIISGVRRPYLARINVDGTLDVSFNPGEGPNSYVYSIASLAQGDLLVAGSFSQFNLNPKMVGLAKLFSDGSVDTRFDPQINATVFAVAVQPDGKILIGGDFTSVGGRVRNRVARLNGDGTLDFSFDPGAGADGSVRSITVLANGRSLVGGAFGYMNGGYRPYFTRLLANGLPDVGFAPSLAGPVYSVALQLDGKMVVGGDFPGRITRLNENGSADPSLVSGITGANSTVFSVALQPDGNILAAGNFSQFNGLSRTLLARIQGLNDSGGGELSFATAQVTVPESQGTFSIDVRRTGNLDNPVTVDYAGQSDSATVADYNLPAGTLVFGSGESRKAIAVSIIQDPRPEDTESFRVTLSNPTGGALLGGNPVLEVRITSEDLFPNPGALDLTVRGGTTLGTAANAVAATTDGKILVAGDFRAILGQNSFNVARLKEDGTVDDTFDPGLFFDAPVYAAKSLENGKVIVAGAFNTVSGVARRFLARLNANGTVDSLFNPGTGANGPIYALQPLAGGDMLVGGGFSAYGGEARVGLVKLLSDGTRDANFNPQLNATVYSIVEQANGKFLVGGDFTSAGGQTRTRIARLNADGSLDASFDPLAGADGSVRAIAIQPDGKILAGGSFGNFNGVSHLYLARLFADGKVDSSYTPSFNTTVNALLVDRASNLHVGGAFTALNGVTQFNYARLKEDGSLDPQSMESAPFNGAVNAIAADAAGRILLAGAFTQVAGLNRALFVRLNAEQQTLPFRFTGLTYASDRVSIFGSGGTAGAASLETSSDLKIWVPLAPVAVGSQEAQFEDTRKAARSYYRLRQP